MADIDTSGLLANETKAATSAALPATKSHVQKAAKVLGNWAGRAAGTGFAAAVLLPWQIDPQCWPQIWLELWQMQNSVWQRQRQLQATWLQGWLAWSREATEARGANTMSALVQQEFDLVGQWHELVSAQVTDTVGLLENLEVNYAFWVHEKLR